jgi:hypothetical protein
MLPPRLQRFLDQTRARFRHWMPARGAAGARFGGTPRGKLIAGAVAVFLLSLPFWAGALARRIAINKVESRLGARLTIGSSRLWYTRLVLDRVSLDQGQVDGVQAAPLAVMKRVVVPLSAAWGAGTIHIEGARFEV